jgi:DNA-nicking Smr family endonuclease
MKVSVGHKVKFINENLEGEIVSIISDKKVLVNCCDGFDHEVLIAEIVIVGEDNTHLYSVDEEEISTKINADANETEKKSFLTKYTNANKYKYEGVLEVDLHLERLVEFPEKLADWQRLQTQMQHVKNCLSSAREKKIKKIVFIHGVGTGVLKTELHNYLANFDNMTIKDADSREYGSGATEVIIKNS